VNLVTAAGSPVTLEILKKTSTLPNWKTQYILSWMLKHDLLARQKAE